MTDSEGKSKWKKALSVLRLPLLFFGGQSEEGKHLSEVTKHGINNQKFQNP